LIQIKVLPAVLQKLVNSQIDSGDRMQTFSEVFTTWLQKAIYYLLANSERVLVSPLQLSSFACGNQTPFYPEISPQLFEN
jgi:hypothetical protein